MPCWYFIPYSNFIHKFTLRPMETLPLIIALVWLAQIIIAVLLFALSSFDRVKFLMEIYLSGVVLYFLFLLPVFACCYGCPEWIMYAYCFGIPVALSIYHVVGVMLHFHLRGRSSKRLQFLSVEPQLNQQ